jgi:hypothetical protein
MSKMGSHDPFGFLKHKLWQKKGRLKVGNCPISLRVGGVPHTIGKLLMKATTLLQTSLQLEVFTQSYGPPKLRES